MKLYETFKFIGNPQQHKEMPDFRCWYTFEAHFRCMLLCNLTRNTTGQLTFIVGCWYSFWCYFCPLLLFWFPLRLFLPPTIIDFLDKIFLLTIIPLYQKILEFYSYNRWVYTRFFVLFCLSFVCLFVLVLALVLKSKIALIIKEFIKPEYIVHVLILKMT